VTKTERSPFAAVDDPGCKHSSHYECVMCRKMVCARCGADLAASTSNWKTIGYWCSECRDPKPPQDP